jgi:DNA-binding NarL/FixJ family response regulator
MDEDHVEARLRSRLDSAELAAALHEGRRLALDDAVREALAAELGVAAPAPAAPVLDRLGLSPREHDVMRLLIEGKSNQEIGEELFISPRTASTHVANILAKLGVTSRTGAVGVALSRGGLD